MAGADMKLPTKQTQPSSLLIPRVVLKNYKSIATCDVALTNLSFLVGPNGSGKSNFVDGLRFVTESLRTSLDHALRDRGGIKEVRRRSGGHPTHFGIRLDLRLGAQRGHYSFRVGAKPKGGFEVQQEECVIGPHSYAVNVGKVISSVPSPPAAASDRLYLVNASGLPQFRGVYDSLSSMGFYSLNPDRIRELQSPDPGKLLTRDAYVLSGRSSWMRPCNTRRGRRLPRATRSEASRPCQGRRSREIPGVRYRGQV